MGIETTPRDAVDHLQSDEAILGYLEAAFEDGDPELIAAALNDFAQARGLTHDGQPRAGNVPGTKNASLPGSPGGDARRTATDKPSRRP